MRIKLWLIWKYKTFIKNQFHKYYYHETYEWFEKQSAQYPRFWCMKKWFSHHSPTTPNPIYSYYHPNDTFWK